MHSSLSSHCHQDIAGQIHASLFNMKINEALLTRSRLEVLLTIAKFEVPRNNFPEQENYLTNWLLNYFISRAEINIGNGHFQPRLSTPSETPIDNILLLYGVDLLSSSTIRNMFSHHRPIIAWINSSQCFLQFSNSEQVHRELRSNIHRFDESKIRPHPTWPTVYCSDWLQLNEYNELGFPRHLFVRNARESDILYTKNSPNSKNYFRNYKKAKATLEEELLKQEKIQFIYRNIISENANIGKQLRSIYSQEEQARPSKNKKRSGTEITSQRKQYLDNQLDNYFKNKIECKFQQQKEAELNKKLVKSTIKFDVQLNEYFKNGNTKIKSSEGLNHASGLKPISQLNHFKQFNPTSTNQFNPSLNPSQPYALPPLQLDSSFQKGQWNKLSEALLNMHFSGDVSAIHKNNSSFLESSRLSSILKNESANSLFIDEDNSYFKC